jgi:hypothetical protein
LSVDPEKVPEPSKRYKPRIPGLEIDDQEPGIVPSFCGRCGTSIGYVDKGISDEYYLTIGFFDHPERFKPAAHGYWRLKLPWIKFSDDLPRVEEYTRRRDPKLGNPNTR